MKKIYFLQNCSTCKRIMNQFDFSGFEKQEIRSKPIDTKQLEELKTLAGNYEALFSRRSTKYKEMGLKDETLTEDDYKFHLLKHYSFLKRPVIVDGREIFIGSEKKNLESLESHFKNL